jgi:ABC-2 type transport system permease protein
MNPTALFSWLRWRQLHNTLHTLMHHALLRMLTIILASGLIWGTIFTLSFMGFRELRFRWEVHLEGDIIAVLFVLMFSSLTLLLIFSTGIILYSSLFSSPESSFLLTAPVADDHVFIYKFQGALAFSSGAFLLLASPILLAYGPLVAEGAPWYFYALLPFYFVGFILIPGGLGGLVCLLLVYGMPQRRKQVLILVILALVGLVGFQVYRMIRSAVESRLLQQTDWVGQLLGEFAVLRGPWMPAQWITRGLRAAAIQEAGEALYYLALVWANGLFLYVAVAWVAARLYRPCFNRLATGGTLRRKYGGRWLDGLVSRTLAFLDTQTRLLIVKDFRTFRRDPAQWAQVLIFLGLAVLYFTNVRRFYEQDIGKRFQNGISVLNLGATAILMCAYTGRFIYPMLSLEGRKFWILGLLPLSRERLLWGKFVFSAVGLILAAGFLSLFGNAMLNMPPVILFVHALTVTVLALGLSGLSVGLSAMMPNFRETDPSKIAVGFGGTLNMICGLFYLLLTVLVMAGPWHLYMLRNGTNEADWSSPWWLWSGVALGAGVGTLTVLLPLRTGSRMLNQMEF